MAASPRKVRGFIHPNQFKKPFFKPFLEVWGGIPAEKKYIKSLETEVKENESLGFSIEGSTTELNGEGYRTAAFIARHKNPLIPVKIDVKKGIFGGFFGGSTKLVVKNEIYVPKEAKRDELIELTKTLMNELE